jgi:hypothetical protein
MALLQSSSCSLQGKNGLSNDPIAFSFTLLQLYIIVKSTQDLCWGLQGTLGVMIQLPGCSLDCAGSLFPTQF